MTNSSLQPSFGETPPTGDPTAFKVPHPNDNPLYNLVVNNLLEPIPAPWNKNVVLTLGNVLGANGTSIIQQIQKAGQIVFHSVGDTGSVNGPQKQNLVTDKLVGDFHNEAPGDEPSFLFHLGDVVYSFGEGKYYYDQFYEPYRDYPAPIIAIPGNHDGLVYKGDTLPTLQAFMRNFVCNEVGYSDDAMGILRTTMTQPGVYFSFDAPFVTIIGLYSNVLEDPGIISSEGNKKSVVDDQQLTFLVNQLNRVKNMGNAVIIVVHHPPFAGGTIQHGGSPKMLADIDAACKKANFWPHVVLSGHAHNYQRYTRMVGKFQIPYIVCGNGGHGLIALSKSSPLRTPHVSANDLIFENYDDKNYGYLRVICNAQELSIEYHDADPTQKSASDVVTINLKSRTKVAGLSSINNKSLNFKKKPGENN